MQVQEYIITGPSYMKQHIIKAVINLSHAPPLLHLICVQVLIPMQGPTNLHDNKLHKSEYYHRSRFPLMVETNILVQVSVLLYTVKQNPSRTTTTSMMQYAFLTCQFKSLYASTQIPKPKIPK